MSRWSQQSLKDRFLDKVHPEPMSGCWLWGAAADENGYGRINVDGRISLSHRVSYSLFCGAVADNDCVLHKCDNPSCVNPEHLWLGDRKDNADDMHAKNRHIYGERHVHHKLKECDAVQIKDSNETLAVLADRFGVSISLVSAIRNGRRWKHLSERRDA